MTFWYWLIIALIFLVIEVFAPGVFFFWMAIAAAIISALVGFVGISGQWQWALFAILSIASIICWQIYSHYFIDHSKAASNGLNERGQDFIGRTFTLSSDIENGVGRLNVEDTYWKIQGDDLKAGEKVKVVNVRGNILIVEKC